MRADHRQPRYRIPRVFPPDNQRNSIRSFIQMRDRQEPRGKEGVSSRVVEYDPYSRLFFFLSQVFFPHFV